MKADDNGVKNLLTTEFLSNEDIDYLYVKEISYS